MDMPDLPKGYRIIPGSERIAGAEFFRTYRLQRWESEVVGPWWRRRLEFSWRDVAEEWYQSYPGRDAPRNRETALKRLAFTAQLADETHPIELRWTR